MDCRLVGKGSSHPNLTAIPNKLQMGKEKLKSLSSSLSYVSATIDIWSDRRMRGYMGITVYWIEPLTFQLRMGLLDVIRIKGSHTATNILEHFDGVMLKFGIKCKTVRIVSDDAANMKKAFEIQLEVPTDVVDDQLEAMDEVPDL